MLGLRILIRWIHLRVRCIYKGSWLRKIVSSWIVTNFLFEAFTCGIERWQISLVGFCRVHSRNLTSIRNALILKYKPLRYLGNFFDLMHCLILNKFTNTRRTYYEKEFDCSFGCRLVKISETPK